MLDTKNKIKVDPPRPIARLDSLKGDRGGNQWTGGLIHMHNNNYYTS